MIDYVITNSFIKKRVNNFSQKLVIIIILGVRWSYAKNISKKSTTFFLNQKIGLYLWIN